MRLSFVPIMVTLAVLVIIYRPVFTLLFASAEAWGYAKINGLSMNLAWRLLHYCLTWLVVGAAAIISSWSFL